MKHTKKILSFFLALLMVISIIPMSTITASAAYENTYVNTGNQRADIIGVAKTQIGYVEGSGNDTKYGDWYGLPGEAWCAMFVSWCANQAGIPTSVLKKTARAHPSNFGISYYDGKSYTPQSGDLFFVNDFSHVGLVYYVEGNYFYTIEGNWSDKVLTQKRKISDFYFGVPNYTNAVKPTISLSTNVVNLTLGGTEVSSVKVDILNNNGNCDIKIERNNDNCWNSLVMGTSSGSLNISAKNVGTTVFTVKLIDLFTNQVIDSKKITANVSAKTYTVSYNANGGSGTPASQTKTHGKTLTLSNTKPTRTGYTFLGWSTSSTATTATYSAGGSFTTNANTTLYAVWKLNEITGTCGENLTWSFNESTGVLTISGTGAMDDYPYNTQPWKNYREKITSISVGNYVTSIGEYAFSKCQGLVSVTIPANVTTIGNGAFSDCTGLTNVNIPDGVTIINDWTFSNCSKLTNITIPNTVTSIGYCAFHSCESLTNITIPNSVTIIGDSVFGWCTSLTSVSIPDSVVSIGDNVFRYCDNLTDIYYLGTEEQWSEILIGLKNDHLTSVTIHFIREEIPDEYTFSIKTPSRTTIRNKDGIILHANVEDTAPAGSYIEWTSNNSNFKTEEINGGNSLKIISNNNGYSTFIVKLYDANGEVLATDSIEMRSKAGFFDKIGGFFRSLFGTTKIYEY